MGEVCHAAGLPVIYHGCGNGKAIFQDYIDMKIDAYNPLEAKAGMDAVELRRQYGHAIGFCGNSNVQIWETGDRDDIPPEGLRQPHCCLAIATGAIPCPRMRPAVRGDEGEDFCRIVRAGRGIGGAACAEGEAGVRQAGSGQANVGQAGCGVTLGSHATE